MSLHKPEIRIQVVCIPKYVNPRHPGSSANLLLVSDEESAFLGTSWRIEPCGALTILHQDAKTLEEKPLYTYAPGRWIEVYEDGEE